jgi:hypothetical protein
MSATTTAEISAEEMAAIDRMIESFLRRTDTGATMSYIRVPTEVFNSLHRRFDAGETSVYTGRRDGTNRLVLRLESGAIVGADCGGEVVTDRAIAILTQTYGGLSRQITAHENAAINRVAESILGGASPPVIPVTDEMFDTLHRRFDAGEVGVAAAGADGTRILLRLESGVIVGADSDHPAGSEVVSDTILAVVPHIVAARQRARARAPAN